MKIPQQNWLLVRVTRIAFRRGFKNEVTREDIKQVTGSAE